MIYGNAIVSVDENENILNLSCLRLLMLIRVCLEPEPRWC